VDVYYYSLNAACKKGVNISTVFDIVHGANMAKRDPATGQFIKREDGKIIKPEGWQGPDIKQEIARQMEHGSFTAGAERDADHVRKATPFPSLILLALHPPPPSLYFPATPCPSLPSPFRDATGVPRS
jgi:hypothetical protein